MHWRCRRLLSHIEWGGHVIKKFIADTLKNLNALHAKVIVDQMSFVWTFKQIVADGARDTAQAFERMFQGVDPLTATSLVTRVVQVRSTASLSNLLTADAAWPERWTQTSGTRQDWVAHVRGRAPVDHREHDSLPNLLRNADDQSSSGIVPWSLTDNHQHLRGDCCSNQGGGKR